MLFSKKCEKFRSNFSHLLAQDLAIHGFKASIFENEY